MLTAEEVVKRIATECAYIDERGGVGIRLKPTASIVREYSNQFRLTRPATPARRPPRGPQGALRNRFTRGGLVWSYPGYGEWFSVSFWLYEAAKGLHELG
jgi:hypothetical protein